MSDPENFLARWSRRKRGAAETSEEAAAPAAPPAPSSDAERPIDSTELEPPAPDRAAPPEPAFDIAQLPSLDSITAETDIRAFLAPGVPVELTRAALRRVWTADPNIRDFVGLAENAWDFTAPGGAPGFGPLEMTDELRKAVADMVGRSLKLAAPEPQPPAAQAGQGLPVSIESSSELAAQVRPALPPAPAAAKVQPRAAPNEIVNSDCKSGSRDEKTQPAQNIIAAQQSARTTENPPVIVSRAHGRALPK